MATILLIRHAQTQAQHPEAELTEDGFAQAQALAPRLVELGVDAIYSSPYRRAIQTAEPFAAQAGLDLMVLEPLHERVLSPVPLEDWEEHLRLSFADRSHAAPGGESNDDVAARVLPALTQVAAAGHTRPAVVTHGGVISGLLHIVDPGFGFEASRGLTNPDLYDLTLRGGLPVAFRHLPLKVPA
ncbi:histidine phosphatase family protein [Halovulum sp. GXIMD14793]